MVANYATVAYCYQTSWPVRREFIPAGATRDSVTDATAIAQWPRRRTGSRDCTGRQYRRRRSVRW